MITYDDALDFLSEAARSRRWTAETVPLTEALGRVCAEKIISPEPSPPFNNSSMDGFAVRSQLTKSASVEAPVSFLVDHLVAAGHAVPRISVGTEAACEIMTGAPLPEAYDAVVKIEDTKVERDLEGRAVRITLAQPLTASQNVRYRGQDFAEGHLILDVGTLLRADHIMGLASLGITKISVARRPRVAVISTGHEIKPFETKQLEAGQIRNSSAPYLAKALPALGFELVSIGTSEDDVSDFLKAFATASSFNPDLILTTGAVSMGRFDFIKEALVQLAAKTVFHKVAIRPGKPILFCELKSGAAFFGLPGNPISTVVGLRFFVVPFVRALWGLAREKPIEATLSRGFEKPPSLRCFMKARLKFTDGQGLTLEAHAGQPSFMISSLNESNAWAIVREGVSSVDAGTSIQVLPLTPNSWEIDA